MRKEDFARPKIPIPHTDCPKCDAPMYLARITPDKLGHDERTFECFECDHSVTEVVKHEPNLSHVSAICSSMMRCGSLTLSSPAIARHSHAF
jgi:hypothetical protein